MTYTTEVVNGVEVPLSAERIAELEARDAAWANRIPEEREYTFAIQQHLDGAAQARGYDSALSISTYAGSSIAGWADEAAAFIAWRDSVWAYALAELAKVQNQERAVPTVEDFLTELPAINWAD